MKSTEYTLLDQEVTTGEIIGTVEYRQLGERYHSLLQDCECLIVVVSDDVVSPRQPEHRLDRTKLYQMIHVRASDLRLWAVSGEERELVRGFLEGITIHDPYGQLDQLRNQILESDELIKEQRKFTEFAKFLRLYVEAKRYSQREDFTDAYQSVIEALYHLASIELIEQGLYSSQGVWEQVRSLNTVVYKLFDELTTSQETLDQRVQLVLLACEFSALSKMADCSSLLLRILRSRVEPWSVQELVQHPELAPVGGDLAMVLRKLVNRSLVNEVYTRTYVVKPFGSEIRYLADRY